MVISRNTQLGLMLLDKNILGEYCEHAQNFLKDLNKEVIATPESEFEEGGRYNLKAKQWNDGDVLFKEIGERLGYKPELKGSEFYTVQHPKPYYYLILSGVEKCASKIRIKDNFSCSIFNRIKDGEHVYLLGKDEVYRFVKHRGAIRAFYWDRGRKIAFEFGMHIEKDKYYFPHTNEEEFNRLVRLMTFVEIGDVEIILLEKGKNNGKSKKENKITNTSENNVYVVDAYWNQIIIRTNGFAVMGHYRLQPCGANFSDRKLIWINAFEKHGYKRQPKAKILND